MHSIDSVACIQGNCSQPAPEIEDRRFEDKDPLQLRDVNELDASIPLDGVCVLFTKSGGLLSFQNINDQGDVLTRPDVWVHGLHVVNIDYATSLWDQRPAIHWEPANETARLWITRTVLQHGTLSVFSGQAFVAGAAPKDLLYHCALPSGAKRRSLLARRPGPRQEPPSC